MGHKIFGPAMRLVVAAAAFTACGDGDAGGEKEVEPSKTMSGTVTAPECIEYDIENGQVILRNEAEEIIGTAQTGARLIPEPSAPCVVAFEISEVPRADFYTLEVGTHSGPAWSHAELESQDFEVELSLGDAVLAPPVPAEDICDSIMDLNDALNDNEVIDARRLWDQALRESAALAEGFGAAMYIEGEQDIGQLSYDFAEAHSPMLWSRWWTIRELNRAGDRMNEAALDLIAELDCDGYWDDVSYVSGD